MKEGQEPEADPEAVSAGVTQDSGVGTEVGFWEEKTGNSRVS